jgi:hypothetical protein
LFKDLGVAGGRRVLPFPLHQVRPVDAGGMDLHQDLPFAGCGSFHLTDLQYLDAAESFHEYRFHRLFLPCKDSLTLYG